MKGKEWNEWKGKKRKGEERHSESQTNVREEFRPRKVSMKELSPIMVLNSAFLWTVIKNSYYNSIGINDNKIAELHVLVTWGSSREGKSYNAFYCRVQNADSLFSVTAVCGYPSSNINNKSATFRLFTSQKFRFSPHVIQSICIESS
jgi:hypothetical protein